ncbi:MAG: hypothetical protein COB35_08020 [Gammaproteobacteria bacterium]|nr:MAG: hypothetical protein COB35_08020 [Gammaproteobacteria bacterium]
MTLIDINKQVYRKHLNIIIIGFIIVFMLLALIFGQGLIAIFADGQASTAQQSNFRYNLVGVVFALIACMVILSQLREQPFFKEVYYVWQLKQVINLIYRKLSLIKKQAAKNDHSALIILNYYYQASQQLYLLDDNTITLSSLNKEFDKVQKQINQLELPISIADFDKDLLKKFNTKK